MIEVKARRKLDAEYTEKKFGRGIRGKHGNSRRRKKRKNIKKSQFLLISCTGFSGHVVRNRPILITIT